MEVLKLLQNENRCLNRLLELSRGFLATIHPGDFTALPQYEARRDAILKTMGLYDRKISEAVSRITLEERTAQLSDRVRNLLNEKERLLAEALSLDNQILSRIESEKMRIQQELTASEKSRTLVEKFKSTWVSESGEELDTQL